MGRSNATGLSALLGLCALEGLHGRRSALVIRHELDLVHHAIPVGVAPGQDLPSLGETIPARNDVTGPEAAPDPLG